MALLLASAGCCGQGKLSNDEIETELDALEAALDAYWETPTGGHQKLLMDVYYASLQTDWDLGNCGEAIRALREEPIVWRIACWKASIDDCKALCGSQKTRGEVLEELIDLEPGQQTPAVLSACDAQGAETVFAGELESLREQMHFTDYWTYRAFFELMRERLVDDIGSERALGLWQEYEATIPEVARGLAVSHPPVREDLELPLSITWRTASPSLMIMVGQTEITVDGQSVVEVVDGQRVAPVHLEGSKLIPLYDALVDKGSEAEKLARQRKEEEEEELAAAVVEETEFVRATPDRSSIAWCEPFEGGRFSIPVPPPYPGGFAPADDTEHGMVKIVTLGGHLGPGYGDGPLTDLLNTNLRCYENSGVFDGWVTIQSDKDIPWSLLEQVMYTAGRVGFDEIHLAVGNGHPAVQTVLGTVPPPIGIIGAPDSPDDGQQVNLTIVISDRGHHVAGRGTFQTKTDGPRIVPLADREPTVPKLGDQYDYDSLQEVLRGIKSEYPEESAVLISASPNTTYESIIHTIDAATSYLPQGAEYPDSLFDFVKLTGEILIHEPIVESDVESGPVGVGQRVYTGDVQVLGAVKRSEVIEAVEQRMESILGCYEQEFAQTPNPQGTTIIKFQIRESGEAPAPKSFHDSLKKPTVVQCLCSVFQTIQFPEPKGGGIAIVSYSLVLKGRPLETTCCP